MRKTAPNNTPRSTGTRFSPPAFPPKAGKADHIVRVSKRTIRGLGNGLYAFAQVLSICASWRLWDLFSFDLSSGF